MNSAVVVSEIIVYPIKSLGGVHMNQWWAEERGFKYDRRWLIIDEQNRFVSQRECPSMALVKVALRNEGILLHHPERADLGILQVPYLPQTSEILQVSVWNSTMESIAVGAIYDRWLSDALDMKVRLVYMPDTTFRAIDLDYAPFDAPVSFADGYPYLLIGQASLDDLNTKLATPIEMQRFRPNLVVEGSLPYDEDYWHELKIGNLQFLGVKPCARCIMTTVNPAIGQKDSPEPLQTLATYRKANNKIYFGQNLMPAKNQAGLISVGDEIFINSIKRRQTAS